MSLSPWLGHISPGSQYSSPAPASCRPSLSSTYASHRFFRVRLGTGSSRDGALHRGQSRLRPGVQYCRRQAAQKLWLHFSTTGSLKISQHMGQVRSTSGSECRPAILTAALPVQPESESGAKVQALLRHGGRPCLHQQALTH